jgi:hypothetical protein
MVTKPKTKAKTPKGKGSVHLDPGHSRVYVDALERRVRTAINETFYTGPRDERGIRPRLDWGTEGSALGDFVENWSTRDAWQEILDDEAKAEEGHRAFGRRMVGNIGRRPSKPHCAKVLVLGWIGNVVADGKKPSITGALARRATAHKAEVVGYLARKKIKADKGLVAALQALDYAAIVK